MEDEDDDPLLGEFLVPQHYSSLLPVKITTSHRRKRNPTGVEATAQRQRKAANERERRRMNSINRGFDRLRARLPLMARLEKKLSKVDTLKYAINYISDLSRLLNEEPSSSSSSSSSCPNRPPRTPTPPQLIIASENRTGLVSLSWSRQLEKFGTARRDNRGSARVSCAKVWVPEFQMDQAFPSCGAIENERIM